MFVFDICIIAPDSLTRIHHEHGFPFILLLFVSSRLLVATLGHFFAFVALRISIYQSRNKQLRVG